MRYLDPRLRHYSNSGHTGILMLVSILTCLWPASHFAWACQISSKSNHPQQSYQVISIFSRWRPAAILDFIRVMVDRPRCALVGLSLVIKFGQRKKANYISPTSAGQKAPTVPIKTKISKVGYPSLSPRRNNVVSNFLIFYWYLHGPCISAAILRCRSD